MSDETETALPAPSARGRSRLHSVGELSFFTGLGIAVSIFWQMLIAFYYGSSKNLDAYFVASTFPGLIVLDFLMAIISVLIPQYAKLTRREERDKLANTLFVSVL